MRLCHLMVYLDLLIPYIGRTCTTALNVSSTGGAFLIMRGITSSRAPTATCDLLLCHAKVMGHEQRAVRVSGQGLDSFIASDAFLIIRGIASSSILRQLRDGLWVHLVEHLQFPAPDPKLLIYTPKVEPLPLAPTLSVTEISTEPLSGAPGSLDTDSGSALKPQASSSALSKLKVTD